MKLDVSGARPWPGPEWDGFRIVLEGSERPGRLGLAQGEAVIHAENGRELYLFGMRRVVMPPGRRPRREHTELLISRVEVSLDDSPARLIADFEPERLMLDIGEERRKTRLEGLLGALRLLQLPPSKGRPQGSQELEDVEGLRRRIEIAAEKIRRNQGNVTVRAVAGEIGYNESTLSKKMRRLGIPLPG